MAASKPFTRQTLNDATPSVQSAVSDIYDKLSAAYSLINTLTANQAPVKSTAPVVTPKSPSPAISVTGSSTASGPTAPSSIAGATGLAANPQYAFLPALTSLPSINPTTGAPYAQDGELIEVTADPGTPGLLYRYCLSETKWAGPLNVSVIEDTHNNRALYPAANYPNSLYYETAAVIPDTDRTVTYISLKIAAGGYAWVYYNGTMIDTSPSLANIPTGLGNNDYGFRYYSTTYDRTWKWFGSAWGYADSSLGAGAQVSTSGGAPQGGYWQVCDGSIVLCALANATLSNITASNAAASGGNNPMIEGGAGGFQQAATKTTFNAAVTTSNNLDAGVTINNPASGGTAVSVALKPHTHASSIVNLNAALNLPNELNGGLPLRVSMAWYMRR